MGRDVLIRSAEPRDIPAMVRMGGDFIAASGAVPFDPAYIASSLRAHLIMGDRFAVVLDVGGEVHGMLCAAATRSPLAPVAIATELVFWIDPDHRGGFAALRLLRAYRDWARAMGCVQASMVALPGRALDQLYGRAGFAPAEIAYSQVL